MACGADQYVGGMSLVRGPNKLLSSAFNHVCLVINYYLNTQRRVTRNSSTLGCVLRVIVLLEGEASAQSEVQNFHISLYFVPFSIPSTLTSPPVPAAEKHPHSMMLPPHCFTIGVVLGRWCFYPDMALIIETKRFNLGFINGRRKHWKCGLNNIRGGGGVGGVVWGSGAPNCTLNSFWCDLFALLNHGKCAKASRI